MGRMRVKGISVAADGASPPAEAKKPGRKPGRARKVELKSSRLQYCRDLLDHKVAEAMPHIADTFAREAMKGSIEYARALALMSTVDQGGPPVKRSGRRLKTLSEILLEEFKKKPPKKVPAAKESGVGADAETE